MWYYLLPVTVNILSMLTRVSVNIYIVYCNWIWWM